MTPKTFMTWLKTFLSEKEISLDEPLEVEGPSGTNYMTIGILLDVMKTAPLKELVGIKTMLVQIDFVNAPVRPYLKHLATAIAK
jgi:hypothetical protein